MIEQLLVSGSKKAKEIRLIVLFSPTGSSTSCFLPSLFTDNLNYKYNYLVCHPVNPPYFVPLVEIVPGKF